MNLEKITLAVCKLCEETGAFIMEEGRRFTQEDIREKSHANFVTYVDVESEQRLKEGLARLIPGCGFIAEESQSQIEGIYTWVIDPLDGTTNFIHGIPVFCISVGLLFEGRIIAGVIFELGQQEMFYTWEGSPSWLNNQVIRVSETSRINDTLLATGFPYYDYSRLDDYLNLFKFLMKSSRGVRRLGSAAADLAYVACGRVDGFYEYGLHPWDVAAGSLLVINAGGKVYDFNQENNYLFQKEIIATNAQIFDRFNELFVEHFG
jgi:myo-inositol-1(or 4)-monophosphatase